MSNRMSGFTRLAAVIALALVTLLTGVATAQDYRGKVQGTVFDPSKAAIAGATVVLTNVNTGIQDTKQTDPAGHYIFDFVQPGTYSVAVEAAGFQKFIQANVTVLTRGDVTVDATLALGGVDQVVSVTADVAAVEFNTSTMTTTVQGAMLKDLPVLARNPFTLALLNPAVVNQYWDTAHRNPFYMWASTGMDVGGSTGGKNDVELDGTTLNIAAKGSYNLPMDAVQEVAVQQNAMDAEFGFSAGGTLNLAMKSGTNDYHGTAYYFGRNPALNALANRLTRDKQNTKQNIWGGTIGSPIKKNKIFNFFTYEQWRSTQPASTRNTVPTAEERTGDFSHALTPTGALRTIYDPWSTKFDPATSTVTRTPFPNNVIPHDRIDPTGQKLINNLWMPNATPDDLSGKNNFKKSYSWWQHYWNISDRTDFNINDNWRVFTRFSKFQTRIDNDNWGGTIAVPSESGGIMDSLNAAMDVLWTASPRTTVNFRFGSTYIEDDYASLWAQTSTKTWQDLWPNGWWKNVVSPAQGIYYPNVSFAGTGTWNGNNWWWLVHGRSHNPTINVTHQVGSHQLKAGWQLRYSYDQNNGNSGPGYMSFNSVDTGSSWLGYNPSLSGDAFASGLLGVVNSGEAMIYPNLDMHQQQWGLYLQDDWKISRNITLNLGLRWERETAPAEETRQLVKTLDLNSPIPELQNITMPEQVRAIQQVNYHFNGAMIYTDNAHPRMYSAPWNTFLPRAGVAIRINDKTALRAGYARYAVPWLTVHAETNGLPTYGFSQETWMLGPQNGVPRTIASDPFPSSNPVVLPQGNKLGRYTNLGNGVNFWDGSLMKTPMNDRINISIQRQAPYKIMTEATFFTMFGHNVQDSYFKGGSFGYNINHIDPNLSYTYKGKLDEQVANPFYGLPTNIMPGSLGVQKTVSVAQLLRPYPQYDNLNVQGWPGRSDRYYSLQLKAERAMANGLMFLVGYNYNQERHSEYFNDVDQFNNVLTMLDRGNPRHNFRVAGTWELPVGRQRRFLSKANPFVDAVIGGWSMSHVMMLRSGNLLKFGPADVSGDPRQNVREGYYFNPDVFQPLQAYTPRTNPWYYSGLRGPSFWQLDSTLSKDFRITERVKFELRLESYNTLNKFMPSDPDLGVGSGTMGRSTWVAGGNYGREIQYTGRIHF